MTSTTPRVWLTPQAHHRLCNELATLLAPARGSEESGDSDFASRRDREARIRQVNDLLTNAIVGEDPPDDGVAEPGMVLDVRFDDTGETETFLLGARGAEHCTFAFEEGKRCNAVRTRADRAGRAGAGICGA